MTKRIIEVVAYDPGWAGAFRELSVKIAAAFGDLALGIEHVGSTAVPGLAAKPILDLDLVIRSRSDLAAAIARLEQLGYQHEGDLGIRGREAFR